MAREENLLTVLRKFSLEPKLSDFVVIRWGTETLFIDVSSITNMVIRHYTFEVTIQMKNGRTYILREPADMTFEELREKMVSFMDRHGCMVWIWRYPDALHKCRIVVSMRSELLVNAIELVFDFVRHGPSSISR